MRVLVTGATGRVGKPFLRSISESSDLELRVATPDPPPSEIACEWIQADFRDPINYDELTKDIDIVVHLAAELHSIDLMLDVNARATALLAEASERSGVKLFLYTSSTMVFGYPRGRSVNEASPTLETDPFPFDNYLSRYAISKLESEKSLDKIADQCCYVVLRPTMLVDNDVIETIFSMSTIRKIWWAHRYTHMIHVDEVAAGLKAIIQNADFRERSKRGQLQIFILSADSAHDRFSELFDDGRFFWGVVRQLGTLGVWADRIKDMLKFRSRRAGWPYGTVSFDSTKLSHYGVTFLPVTSRH